MEPAQSTSLASLFFAGEHRALVERTIDSPSPSYLLGDFPYILGALVILGRIEEAEMAFLLKKDQLDETQKTACRFYLGCGFCRHSFYEKSLEYFVENIRARRKATDALSRFYRFNGLGFYLYFAGRMPKALKAAERSYEAALEAGYLYGRALAADLKGHTLVMTGQVGHGLRTLGLAEHLANQVGARWLEEAIQSSVLSYRAQFGMEGKTCVARLKSRIQNLSKQDIFTQSSLYLTLCQAYLREGRLNEARDALNECCRIVYGSQNRRHAALLNLRYAYLHHLEGDPHLALNLVRNALTQIDLRVDRLLELRLRGFERKLVKHLKIAVCEKILEEKVTALTLRVGETVGKRMLHREKSPLSQVLGLGEDPIGDLRDQMLRDPEGAQEIILKKGYFGLLSEILPIQPGERVLYLELEPDSLTVFDKGNVEHHPQSLSRSLRALLCELGSGPKTKQQLIERVWQYTYHPLRHDALIYSAIAKLRKTLGSRSHWVEASDSGYQLRTGARVLLPSRVVIETPLMDSESLLMTASPAFVSGPELNSRQKKIIRFLHQNEFIDTSTCSELFETSEITASRDLSELLKLQFIERVGKGRATKYTRNSNQGA
jgi:hypothetical protein